MAVIDNFRGEYKFLSNFYLTPVMHEGMTYRSSEHAYQATKTLDMLLRRGIQVLTSPGSAKVVGDALPLRPDWEDIKVDVMRTILRVKFSKGSDLSALLMATSPHELIEGNRWHDNFWGVCRCPGCSGGVPSEQLNWLGKLLMERREQFHAGIE